MQIFNLSRCSIERSLEVLWRNGLGCTKRPASGSCIQTLGPKYRMSKYGPFEKNYYTLTVRIDSYLPQKKNVNSGTNPSQQPECTFETRRAKRCCSRNNAFAVNAWRLPDLKLEGPSLNWEVLIYTYSGTYRYIPLFRAHTSNSCSRVPVNTCTCWAIKASQIKGANLRMVRTFYQH